SGSRVGGAALRLVLPGPPAPRMDQCGSGRLGGPFAELGEEMAGSLETRHPPDLALFPSRSHARHTPSPPTPQPVVARILALGDEPPDHLRRVPGPRTILAVLH